MENQSNEKKCQNCRWYLQHYVKSRRKFLTTECGHCACSERKNRRKQVEFCQYWQPQAIAIAKRRKYIKDYLIFISQRIDEIASILQSDTTE